MKHTGLFIFKPTSLLDEITRFWLIQMLASKAEFKEYSSLYLWASKEFATLAHSSEIVTEQFFSPNRTENGILPETDRLNNSWSHQCPCWYFWVQFNICLKHSAYNSFWVVSTQWLYFKKSLMHCFQFNVFKVLWKHWNTRAYAHASLVHTSHNAQKERCTGKKSSMSSVHHNTGQLLGHLKYELPKWCQHQKNSHVSLYKLSHSCFLAIFLHFSFTYPIPSAQPNSFSQSGSYSSDVLTSYVRGCFVQKVFVVDL